MSSIHNEQRWFKILHYLNLLITLKPQDCTCFHVTFPISSRLYTRGVVVMFSYTPFSILLRATFLRSTDIADCFFKPKICQMILSSIVMLSGELFNRKCVTLCALSTSEVALCLLQLLFQFVTKSFCSLAVLHLVYVL